MRIPLRAMFGCLLAMPGLAQQWTFGQEITGRGSPGLAYDLARARTVLFGGSVEGTLTDETWQHDGLDWRRATPPVRPPARAQAALTYDAARTRVVLFGGLRTTGTPTYGNDTWEFDGVTWTQTVTANAPSARRTAIAFDHQRAVTVLFGGDANSTALGDTWTYDGVDWTQRAPANAPAARTGHALAHDVVRGRTVLFGAGPVPAETWEFDGANWTQVIPITAPVWRRDHGMTFDLVRQRVVVFGGYSRFALLGPDLTDTWEFDGNTWTQRTSVHAPTPQSSVAIVHDAARQQLLMFGSGPGPNDSTADTWTLDSTDWNQVGMPIARSQTAIVDDTLRGRTILYGGVGSSYLGDTWEHDGVRWRRVLNPGSPQLYGHALAFDPHRARTVLFGGAFFFTAFDATWEYDGATWTQRAIAVRPPARLGHALAYDAARRRVVLFGGATSQTAVYFADTWEYDGSAWQQRPQLSVLPAARSGHAMVYETANARTLLFGGTNNPSFAGFSDTWIWDGTFWVQLAPPHVPSARHGHGLAYDPRRGRAVLFGGAINANNALDDTWEFDGLDWTQQNVAPAPIAQACAMTYQSATGRVISFGGHSQLGRDLADTKTYTSATTATWTRFGRGCAGSVGVPVLDRAAGALPTLGSTFSLQLSGLPATPGFALLAFGADSAHWNGLALPFALDAVGLPGCDLWLAPTIGASVLVPYATTGSFALALPNVPAFAGTALAAQALILDPAAPSGLGAVTNAGILVPR